MIIRRVLSLTLLVLLVACADEPTSPTAQRWTAPQQLANVWRCAVPGTETIRHFLFDPATGVVSEPANGGIVYVSKLNGYEVEYYARVMCPEGGELSPEFASVSFGQPVGSEANLDIASEAYRQAYWSEGNGGTYTGRSLRALKALTETQVFATYGRSTQSIKVRVRAPTSIDWDAPYLETGVRHGSTEPAPPRRAGDGWGLEMPAGYLGREYFTFSAPGIVTADKQEVLYGAQCGETEAVAHVTTTIPWSGQVVEAYSWPLTIYVVDCVGRVEITPSPVRMLVGGATTVTTHVRTTEEAFRTDLEDDVVLSFSDPSLSLSTTNPKRFSASAVGTYSVSGTVLGVTGTAPVEVAAPLAGSIVGPTQVKSGASCTWSIAVTGGFPPYVIKWIASGAWNWSETAGTGPVLNYAFPLSGSSMLLEVKVTDSAGHSAYVDSHTVNVNKTLTTHCAS